MKLMEDLWYSYELDKSANLTKEEREMMSVLNQKREILTSDMSEEKIKLFEVYEEGVNFMHSNREKNSFIQGVCFGVRLLTEAFQKDFF